MAYKEIANSKPFIINKNLGSAMVLDSQDFTQTIRPADSRQIY